MSIEGGNKKPNNPNIPKTEKFNKFRAFLLTIATTTALGLTTQLPGFAAQKNPKTDLQKLNPANGEQIAQIPADERFKENQFNEYNKNSDVYYRELDNLRRTGATEINIRGRNDAVDQNGNPINSSDFRETQRRINLRNRYNPNQNFNLYGEDFNNPIPVRMPNPGQIPPDSSDYNPERFIPYNSNFPQSPIPAPGNPYGN